MSDTQTLSGTKLARRALGRGRDATPVGKPLSAYRRKARVEIVARSVANGIRPTVSETGVTEGTIQYWRHRVRHGFYPAPASLRAKLGAKMPEAAPSQTPAKAHSATPNLDALLAAPAQTTAHTAAQTRDAGASGAVQRGLCYEFISAKGSVRLPLTADVALVRHAIDRVLGGATD